MPLKLRILSLIVPIFVGIAIFLGILKYKTEQREVLWGIKEYVGSLGESIHQFVPFAQIKSYFDGDNDAEFVKNIAAIIEWNPSFKGLWLIKVNDPNERVFVSGIKVGKKLTPILLNDFNFDNGDGNLFLITHISNDPETKWGLVIDISEAKQDLRNSLIESFIFGIVISLIGVLISLFISKILRTNFFYLNQSAKKVILGDYKQIVSTRSSVQEIIDLANTFDTMRNVLSDFLERIQRRSIGQQVSSKSLRMPTKNYNSIIWQNKKVEIHGVAIRLEFINMSNFTLNRDFGGIFIDKKKAFAFIGKIHIKEQNERFSQNVNTSLAKILFENGLQSNLSIEESFNHLANLFDMECFFCFEISSNKKLRLNQLENNHIKTFEVDLSNPEVFTIHTFDSKKSYALNEVVAQVSDPNSIPIQFFIKHLSDDPGSLLLLSKL